MTETDRLVVGSGNRPLRGEAPDFGGFLGPPGIACVLDGQGRPIRGLYAAGNGMTSVMSGSYPGAGIAIGPALTFGYIAARHAAGLAGPPGP